MDSFKRLCKWSALRGVHDALLTGGQYLMSNCNVKAFLRDVFYLIYRATVEQKFIIVSFRLNAHYTLKEQSLYGYVVS